MFKFLIFFIFPLLNYAIESIPECNRHFLENNFKSPKLDSSELTFYFGDQLTGKAAKERALDLKISGWGAKTFKDPFGKEHYSITRGRKVIDSQKEFFSRSCPIVDSITISELCSYSEVNDYAKCQKTCVWSVSEIDCSPY